MRFKTWGGILAAFALLAQLLAPAAAARLVSAHGDQGIICALAAGTSADNRSHDGAPAHHEHCPLCQIAVANAPLLDVRCESFASPYPETRPIAWTAPANALLHFGIDQRKPPRGPPFLI
ncbi:MAG: DUF2946 family protein [Alphaproteobacteria bacterium]|nr:DUF2946 family protein [Alphaproteobacteria bacterium]MCL2453460.1 DUF2946 family protein [Alphaproteobacteria bacterium]